MNKLYEFIDKFKNYKETNSNEADVINDLKIIVNEVSENIETFQFNKAVAKIYEYVNILNEKILKNKLSEKDFEWSLKKLSVILQPFVPHISEEIWSGIGNENLCIEEKWIAENAKQEAQLKIAVQINGKTREIIKISDQNISKDKILEIVKKKDKIKKNLLGKNIKREIYVPGKIINLVV
tara:strand:- start:93 stop:635 length:543 start_codon:yes stop_codon:yes gene_type:complete